MTTAEFATFTFGKGQEEMYGGCGSRRSEAAATGSLGQLPMLLWMGTWQHHNPLQQIHTPAHILVKPKRV